MHVSGLSSLLRLCCRCLWSLLWAGVAEARAATTSATTLPVEDVAPVMQTASRRFFTASLAVAGR